MSSNGSFGTGVYRLFNYTGTLTGSGLSVGNVPGGINVPDLTVQTTTAGQVNLVTRPTTTSFWNGGVGGAGLIQGGSGTWNANTIWTNAAADNSATIQPAALPCSRASTLASLAPRFRPRPAARPRRRQL